jgi:periplasmic protein TonB
MNNALHKKRRLTDTLAMTLSLTIHGLIFLIAYYLLAIQHQAGSPSQPYKVELDLQSFHTAPPAPVEQVSPAPSINHVSKKVTAQPREKAEQQPPTQITENQPSAPTEEPAIDTRGLYTSGDNDKRTGASLEMTGWIWDAVPHPQDDTAEIGKLVFEITIDDTGEIIGIKTLEKTVSPLVEQLYKEEVAKLTFSKTSKELTYAATSTGKITFILQYK